MGSTFGGLEISKRGLVVHQTALNTVGHNISNADNPNYARQRVAMQSTDPLYEPSFNRAQGPGMIGQGVEIASIERVRDAFYDDQIIDLENSKNMWEARQNYLVQMEHVFNEPSDNTLRSLTDKFWGAWQELANFPAEMSHREVVLERGQALTTRVNDIYTKLAELRQQANNEVNTTVDQINSLATEIRDLNIRILKSQALGDSPNDLLDRRDAALESLSQLANVRVGRNDRDEVFVFIGEQALVQGEILHKLRTEPDANNEGMSRIVWAHNDRDLILGGGKLMGLLDVRDHAIVERINAVDTFAVNLTDVVNEAHRDGFGLNGSTNRDFFHLQPLSPNARGSYQLQNAAANFDLNQDGTAEVTAVFRVTGTNVVDPTRRVGVDGTLSLMRNDAANTVVRIDYSRDDTMNDIIRRINDSDAGVVAYMSHDNQLAIKALTASDDRRSNFMIRHLEDSGELLVGYAGILNSAGEAGAYDFRRVNEIAKLRSPLQDITLTPIFHPSAYMQLSAQVARDPASIAAGRGADIGGTGDYNQAGGAGDGSNALLIAAALKQERRMIGDAANTEEFYTQLIARLGTESRAAENNVLRQKDDLVHLNKMRQSVMGVSLDEEMSNMVQFQHSYNASAKVISTQDQILDTIINRLKI
ncbi:MAG: flagellar hook-associated protein FlgK [Leptospirales bacterium]|nr:flagellar hook-associated protein FlgK [Leptospirales bacterium]